MTNYAKHINPLGDKSLIFLRSLVLAVQDEKIDCTTDDNSRQPRI